MTIMNAEQTAAAQALDALYAKYGTDNMGDFDLATEKESAWDDREEAYRLRAIIWGEEPCDECETGEEHSRNIECTECGGTRPDCQCQQEN